MKRDFPKLTVHAVGLGLRKEDASRLACLLRDTGGRLFDAQEAADVAPMIRAALQASATTADVAPPPPKVEPVEPDRPGLRLSVAIGSAQTSIELPVRYTVSRDEAGTDMLADIVAPTLDLDLDPGRYYVAVTAGLVETRRVVDVKAGPAPRVTLQLEAGVLDVTTPLTKGAASSATATVTVTNQNPRATARASYPLILGATVSDLVLPSGSWLLTARDGLAKAERTISITDGTHSDVELPLDAGRLSIQVTSPAGAGPSRNATLVAILEDDPDSPGGRREVARTLAPTAEFVLPSGTYTVLARSGSVETRERVSLRAGETAVRTLTVQMARLAVSMKVAPESEDGAQWRLSRADTGRDVGRAAEPSPSFEVPAGTYRLEARLGAQNAVLTRDVDLKAGSDQRLVVDVPAGRLRLRLAEAIAGLGFSEVFWEISDDKGAPVWRTGTAEPALTLAPGRYRMRVETRERALTGTFDVRAGENRTIEIGG
jgi:Ca-activated chloride channel family protein